MNSIIERLMGLDTLTDQTIAMDMLVSAKSGIINYAMAATEAATPELRETFVRHLFEAIDTHEKLTVYMMQHGFYHPYNLPEQLKLDQKNAQTALSIPS